MVFNPPVKMSSKTSWSNDTDGSYDETDVDECSAGNAEMGNKHKKRTQVSTEFGDNFVFLVLRLSLFILFCLVATVFVFLYMDFLFELD